MACYLADPSHYLNQFWNIVDRTPGNIQWNSYIYIQENAYENVVWNMAAILSEPQCIIETWGTNGARPSADTVMDGLLSIIGFQWFGITL